jgi:hypothetical protein
MGFALPGLRDENLEFLPLSQSKSTGQASVSSRAKIFRLGKIYALRRLHFSFFALNYWFDRASVKNLVLMMSVP